MIIREFPYVDENGNKYYELERYYSDKGVMICQKETGVKYSEAVDVYPCRYTYEETETSIED